ncbi:FecCD family ABC transporter permease [Ruicaihuangia caeni]|uniref:FecCD family ABC transporter permease n=1 Tax=Ruicaihuangia caeni TaxID=3042517 RepID=UPI003390136D
MTASVARAALAPADGERRHRSRRHGTVTAVLALLLIALTVGGLLAGPFGVGVEELLRLVTGAASGATEFVVVTLRMPRLALGALVGAALALAGALFQTVLRNPLASPDIIGVSQGAVAAAAAGMLLFGLSGAPLALMAFAGAVTVAAAISLIAGRGRAAGYRFVLTGVGAAFFLQACTGLLLTRGEVREVQQALVWMVGGLSGAAWPDVAVLAGAFAVLMVAAALTARPLRILQLGDDAAAGLGVRADRARPTVLAVGVGLAAVAVAFAGPMVFVAFISAPIVRRLLGDGSLALVPTALFGAALVLAADLVAQYAIPGAQLPAGIVTGLIGAPYLLWLLATRRGGSS